MHRLRTVGCILLLLLSTMVSSVAVVTPISATSTSNQFCTDSPLNPVLNDTGGHFVNYGYGYYYLYNADYEQPSVLRENGRYLMWVAAEVDNVSGIFTASSNDGVYWNPNSKPVLTQGVNGSWDAASVYGPSVVWNGTEYLMYFSGRNLLPQTRSIGVAFSTDNVHWREYSHNPIITGGPGIYDSFWARFPNVILDNGTYKMWYTGAYPLNYTVAGAIGIDYATSRDGLHWTKYPGNPVFIANGTEDVFGTEHPSVVKINGTYLMAFDDSDDRISYAFSLDGISWKASDASLVTLSARWDNSSVRSPTVIVNGSRILLWYFGSSTESVGRSFTAGIGLAYCNFVLVASTKTETQSVTATSTTTVTLTLTSTESSTVTHTTTVTTSTEGIGSGAIPLLYVAAFVVGVLAASITAILVTRSRRQPSPPI